MSPSLNEICCARLPATAIPALSGLRCTPGIRAITAGDSLWLFWPSGRDDVLAQVLPLQGIELFAERGGEWFRFGRRLPTQGPPADVPAQPLDHLLVPAPIRAEEPRPASSTRRVRLQLVRDPRPRPTTALHTSLRVLAQWVETATRQQIESLRGAWHHDRVLVVGHRLPLLPDSTRLWGSRVLIPLGFRPHPALPEDALCDVIGLAPQHLALLGNEGIEILSGDMLQPLTRARVRLAAGEGTS